ncbi:MAG TPA: DUF2243 domain-containing protein [Ardenticatenaceae bacterium]|nr:DUF2243 domain-containing protein [Ardenticatenaceae bacterium]
MRERGDQGPVQRAGMVLGLGLGGFVDGIVLHQILQWHHMLTSAGYPPDSVRNLQINTLADGLFHAATWVLTFVGLLMLWGVRRAGAAWTRQTVIGAMLMGWGIFNLVEGIVDHQLLGIHHVRPGPNQLFWDLAFLAFGALLLLVGWMLVRGDRPKPAGTGATTGSRS